MEIRLARCSVRSWLETDARSLADHANNRAVWINLRDRFPHPYRLRDARAFIGHAVSAVPETRFAITVDGAAVGGIGFTLDDDVERVGAEIGYWLGEAFWGRGITTEALVAVTAFAIREHRLTRVYAIPFEWNAASFRVLEKAGYVCEGRMRRSAIKDGRVIDQLLYAYVVAPTEEAVTDRPAPRDGSSLRGPSRGGALRSDPATGLPRLFLGAAFVALLASGCATTDALNRDRLASEAMALDSESGLRQLRLKIEAAREASLGGYGEASPGGCGCQ